MNGPPLPRCLLRCGSDSANVPSDEEDEILPLSPPRLCKTSSTLWNRAPVDVAIAVLGFLTFPDCHQLCRCSRALYRLCTDSNHFCNAAATRMSLPYGGLGEQTDFHWRALLLLAAGIDMQSLNTSPLTNSSPSRRKELLAALLPAGLERWHAILSSMACVRARLASFCGPASAECASITTFAEALISLFSFEVTRLRTTFIVDGTEVLDIARELAEEHAISTVALHHATTSGGDSSSNAATPAGRDSSVGPLLQALAHHRLPPVARQDARRVHAFYQGVCNYIPLILRFSNVAELPSAQSVFDSLLSTLTRDGEEPRRLEIWSLLHAPQLHKASSSCSDSEDPCFGMRQGASSDSCAKQELNLKQPDPTAFSWSACCGDTVPSRFLQRTCTLSRVSVFSLVRLCITQPCFAENLERATQLLEHSS